jgi:hypothetical protein
VYGPSHLGTDLPSMDCVETGRHDMSTKSPSSNLEDASFIKSALGIIFSLPLSIDGVALFPSKNASEASVRDPSSRFFSKRSLNTQQSSLDFMTENSMVWAIVRLVSHVCF